MFIYRKYNLYTEKIVALSAAFLLPATGVRFFIFNESGILGYYFLGRLLLRQVVGETCGFFIQNYNFSYFC